MIFWLGGKVDAMIPLYLFFWLFGVETFCGSYITIFLSTSVTIPRLNLRYNLVTCKSSDISQVGG